MPLSRGDKLGPYEILSPLGTGGMGEVWKARDSRLDRIVAIKVSKERYSQRFSHEARTVAQLNHPHICQVHDVGPNYLVMEYCDGAPLKGPLPPAEALRLGIQIAEALEAAHAKQIVHRDLKPANIFVSGGSIKLLDFGLAKITEPVQIAEDASTLTRTQAGAILGTPAYMSPEQAEGKVVDARSDIFSFGLVLYEMLSGRRAFEGESRLSMLAAILRDEPRPLEAPRDLQRIVTRCLHKSPSDRFQSMTEVKGALRQAATAPSEEKPSIAVLPFANMSGAQNDEYFSDGLAEEIINALSRIPGLKVIARTSTFAFKGKQEDIRRIADALGVTSILEGSVRKSGNRVRITTQLIAAADGSHLWSERFDREMTDIFAIQDEISQAITDALKVKLGGSKPASGVLRQPVNPEAYEAYLEGRYYVHQMTPPGMARARECFERAIRLDATYSLPHAALAECAYFQVMFMGARPREITPAALASANRALALDPACTEAYTMRGTIRAFYEYDWSAADQDLARAANPSPVYAAAYAVWSLATRGRLEESLAWIKRALESDPMNVSLRNDEVWILGVMRAGERAVERARAVMDLYRGYWSSCYMCAVTFTFEGLHDEAASALEQALAINPHIPLLWGSLAWVRGRQGKLAEARLLRAQVEELAGTHYVSPVTRAFAAEGCGDIDRVYQLLDQAMEEREAMAPVFLVARRPDLQSDPRYHALLHKMNLA